MSLEKSPSSACSHSLLRYTPSSHADKVRYQSRTEQQLATAAGHKGTEKSISERMFPGPLLLPGDDLSSDPRYPPQSLRSWIALKERNEVTHRRNVIYICGPPAIEPSLQYIREWSLPQGQYPSQEVSVTPPRPQDMADYLAAFYHGLRVKTFSPDALRFSEWIDGKGRKAKADPAHIGLDTADESIRIRVRPSPDGTFQGQLNLNDLLDTALSILPDDAYALMMLVEHDLFEDEDDDFCCGRAYGGSRVAVVSMARYNPVLDASQHVERQHAWPASHCEAYVQNCCKEQSKKTGKTSRKAVTTDEATITPSSLTNASTSNMTPLQAAVDAYRGRTSPDVSGLWLSRVCQTASHELGHCFGMDHCVYYACVMQSTSSLAEDVRQPPYLCPVDHAKVARATGTNERARYEALLSFCINHAHAPMFAAFAAWLRIILGQGDGRREQTSPASGSRHKPIEL
ncbi:hypothetical protein ACLMJK_005710 [Lecanora helva]